MENESYIVTNGMGYLKELVELLSFYTVQVNILFYFQET